MPGFGASAGDTSSSKSVYHLWQGFSIGAVIVGGITTALMVYAVVRYRRRGDAIPEQHQYHLPLEVIYTVIPILIVFGLFGATLVVENQETSNPATDVIINVNAFQWGWQFTYPDSNALVYGQTTQDPIMEMPVNTNVHINLTSTDVIHGFYVHDFNFSRYALPGVVNQFTFRAENTGTFFGQCTQLCGLYHSLMFFNVVALPPNQFRAWLSSQQKLAQSASTVSTSNSTTKAAA